VPGASFESFFLVEVQDFGFRCGFVVGTEAEADYRSSGMQKSEPNRKTEKSTIRCLVVLGFQMRCAHPEQS
jgi:hypothetical protein